MRNDEEPVVVDGAPFLTSRDEIPNPCGSVPAFFALITSAIGFALKQDVKWVIRLGDVAYYVHASKPSKLNRSLIPVLSPLTQFFFTCPMIPNIVCREVRTFTFQLLLA